MASNTTLWRAVDQDGEIVDAYLQAKHDGAAAKLFFKRLLRSHGADPRRIVIDKLRSYPIVRREMLLETIHSTKHHENNRVERSHEATRVREQGVSTFNEWSRAVA